MASRSRARSGFDSLPETPSKTKTSQAEEPPSIPEAPNLVNDGISPVLNRNPTAI